MFYQRSGVNRVQLILFFKKSISKREKIHTINDSGEDVEDSGEDDGGGDGGGDGGNDDGDNVDNNCKYIRFSMQKKTKMKTNL